MIDKKRSLGEICEELCPGVTARNADAFKRDPERCAHGLKISECPSPMCSPSTPAPQGDKCAHAPEPELPWDMPSADKLVYGSIAAKSPEERSYLQHMAKKYVDMTAQAIINCDAIRERAVTAESTLARERESRKQAEVEAFNAGWDAHEDATDGRIDFVLCRRPLSDAQKDAVRLVRDDIAALSKPVQEPAERERGK
jgi:hypothetical protein